MKTKTADVARIVAELRLFNHDEAADLIERITGDPKQSAATDYREG